MASNVSSRELHHTDTEEEVELQDLTNDEVDDIRSPSGQSSSEAQLSRAEGGRLTESSGSNNSTIIPGTPEPTSLSTPPVRRTIRIENSSPPPEYRSLEQQSDPRRLPVLARTMPRIRPVEGESPPSYEGLAERHPVEQETSFVREPPPKYNDIVSDEADEATNNSQMNGESSQAAPDLTNEPRNVFQGRTEDEINNDEDVEATGKCHSMLKCVNRPECVACRMNLRERCNNFPIFVKVLLGVALVFLACVILFPIQFSYVQYHKWALVRRKSTGVVERGRVYESGCYALGADRTFVYLPRNIQQVSFIKVVMFTSDTVEVTIDLNVFYQIRYDGVVSIYQRYAHGYGKIIEKIILSEVRNYAPLIHSDSYTSNRSMVEMSLHQALIHRFDGFGIDVPFMDIVQFDLPARVKELKLTKLLFSVDIEKELSVREASLISLETYRQLVVINMQAAELINNATYQAAATTMLAETDKRNYIDEMHSIAYADMSALLGLTFENHSMSFFYLATLRTMDKYHGSIGFDTLMNYVQSGSWSN